MYQPHRFLNAVCDNFQRCFNGQQDEAWIGLLLLADTSSQDTIRTLQAAEVKGWSLEPTHDDCAWLAFHEGCLRLVLVAGRQIETAERLELMALATNETFPNGHSIEETLNLISSSGALPVLPWGFAKWSFHRGTIVRKLLRTLSAGDLDLDQEVFLGDSGGRARMLHTPGLLKLAADLGVRILPGSDPLPLARHFARAGSYGFSLTARCDVLQPATQLKSLLATDRSQPQIHGRLQPASEFVRSQVAMQLRSMGALQN